MATFIEILFDFALPLAARWIVIQVCSFFGMDLNSSTALWVITIAACAIVAETFTFQIKRKHPSSSEETKDLGNTPMVLPDLPETEEYPSSEQ